MKMSFKFKIKKLLEYYYSKQSIPVTPFTTYLVIYNRNV
jgi:hypothetical protein